MSTYKSGIDCTVAIGTARANWSEYTFSEEQETGSKFLPGKGRNVMYPLGQKATISLKGFDTSDEAFVDLAELGSPITSIAATGLPTDLVARCGEWRVTKLDFSQADDLGNWTMEITGYFSDSTAGSGSG